MSFLRLIRYPNLCIVALTQFLFYWFIQKVFGLYHLSPILDLFHFSLLVFTTIGIAASGYIINDLMDYDIDLINKPERMIIGQAISIKQAHLLYQLVIILGGLIAIYLAWYVQNLFLFLIYPLAVFIMWYYSKSLKQKPLSGNLVVALFAAFVPGIVWFAERAGFSELDTGSGNQISNLFQFYMVFAFCSTLFREVIKDIEDYQGDLNQDCKTLPIVLGIPTAKRFALLLGLLLLGTIFYWIVSQWQALKLVLIIFTILLLIIPTLVSIASLYQASDKQAFHKSSQITKGVMLAGLLYLLLFLFF